MIGASGDRWIEPFLEANREHLKRLKLEPAIDARGSLGVQLTPGARIGAVPLLSPSTRKVVAGLLVSPRFRWSALGSVLGSIGFATEPSVGGTVLVPGSAREVPVWLLAAPVVKRLEQLLQHRKRGFVEHEEERRSPRGRVDWAKWAHSHVPNARWSTLPCRFPNQEDDPQLIAAVRWTLSHLDDELSPLQEASAARLLRERVALLLANLGPGPARRPSQHAMVGDSAWVFDAIQAMSWVSEERGLGGSRALDGMSWDLAIDEVWEAWVDRFIAELAPRCGLLALRRGHTRQRLNWTTSLTSMRALVPDTGLRGRERMVWVDAKYKAHLQQLGQKGWTGLSDQLRDAHRSDLHQALAYTSLQDSAHVDSLLVYPDLSQEQRSAPAIANIAAGRRRVRLVLIGLPFGFRSPQHHEQSLTAWRELLAS